MADPEDRMPPSESLKILTADEVETLRQSIENGAPWERHWAFEPISSPIPPGVLNLEWVRNPIDMFILARLESLGIPPSDEADRRSSRGD